MISDVLLVFAILTLLAAVVIWIRKRSWPNKRPRSRSAANVHVMIVLGSGGHTSEMFKFASTLDWKIFRKVTYVVADTDKDSAGKAERFMRQLGTPTPPFEIVKIPRSREILANGPGTCVPICALGIGFNTFGIHQTVVVLSESYACVKHLSVTAKILRHVVDIFFVQWPNLLDVAPKAIYSGRLPESAAQDRATKAKNKGKPDDRLGYILITVGSTKFDDLIQAVDSIQFAETASKLGFSGIHVQNGRGDYTPRVLPAMAAPGFDIKVFEFTNDWEAEVVGSALVIGHAGAGTILDSLEKGKAIIVVPNTKLMNNHQVDIAEELAHRGYVTISAPSSLTATLSTLEIFDLKTFPQRESPVFKTQIESKLNISS